jgi:type VI secretion system secreted protein VgrG
MSAHSSQAKANLSALGLRTPRSKNREITIDSNEQGNPTEIVQSLAHEVGHAQYPYVQDVSSKPAFMNGTLADEGAATMNNMKVQREIEANGGPDIGLSGNPANHAA